MASAPQADPELIGLPGVAGCRVSKLHLVATPLTADANLNVGHKRF
jgi:hypothetical protein